jgi:hypothetical protein
LKFRTSCGCAPSRYGSRRPRWHTPSSKR